MNNLEAVSYVKGLNIDEKAKAALLMALINGDSTTKTTVITKKVEPEAKTVKAVNASKATKSVKATNAAKQTESVEPVEIGDIFIIQYSDKSGAIIGDTKPIKETLKDLKLTFNRFLNIQDNKAKGFKKGDKVAGWLFSMKRIDDVIEGLSEVNFTNLIKPEKKSR